MKKYGVIAIHGGKIEPGTTEITKNIARDDFLFYSNEEGQHIPSSVFNSQELGDLLYEVETVISIHGEKNKEESFVMIGGMDINLGDKIRHGLEKHGFKTKNPPDNLSGNNPENVCNKGKSGKGVQLEISRKLRDGLLENTETMELFCGSIRKDMF